LVFMCRLIAILAANYVTQPWISFLLPVFLANVRFSSAVNFEVEFELKNRLPQFSISAQISAVPIAKLKIPSVERVPEVAAYGRRAENITTNDQLNLEFLD
jgi:hypothetical protein